MLLTHEGLVHDYMDIDNDGQAIEGLRPSWRPYYLRSRGQQVARTFTKLASAAAAFLTEVCRRLPKGDDPAGLG